MSCVIEQDAFLQVIEAGKEEGWTIDVRPNKRRTEILAEWSSPIDVRYRLQQFYLESDRARFPDGRLYRVRAINPKGFAVMAATVCVKPEDASTGLPEEASPAVVELDIPSSPPPIPHEPQSTPPSADPNPLMQAFAKGLAIFGRRK